MLTDSSKINGLPIRTEIRIPREWGGETRWLSSIVVCQDESKGTFVVWSIYATAERPGYIHAENGIYDIRTYSEALTKALSRTNSQLD